MAFFAVVRTRNLLRYAAPCRFISNVRPISNSSATIFTKADDVVADESPLPSSAPFSSDVAPSDVHYLPYSKYIAPETASSQIVAAPKPRNLWDESLLYEYLGFDPLYPMQVSLELLHNYGSPWWLSIAATGLVVRAMQFPLLLLTRREMMKSTRIAPEVAFLSSLYKLSPDSAREKATNMWQGLRQLLRTHNLHPFRAMLMPWPQTFLFVFFTAAVRRVLERHPDVSTGGLAWFEHLGVADPTGILPVTAVALTCMNLQMMKTPHGFIRKFYSIGQAMLLLCLPFTIQIPAGVFLYWIPGAIYIRLQTQILRNPKFESFLGTSAPPLPFIVPRNGTPPPPSSTRSLLMDRTRAKK